MRQITSPYKYEKGVPASGESKRDRLKSKLGSIFDLFQRTEEVASVSYYSSKHSHTQSMEAISEAEVPPKDTQTQLKGGEVKPKGLNEPNIFDVK